MLAVKTTCKDRWRQILTEADRIRGEASADAAGGGVAGAEAEIWRAGVTLAVPAALHRRFGRGVRDEILAVQAFVRETGRVCA